MPLIQADRLIFSLAEVQADQQIAGINNAKSQIEAQITGVQALDAANDRLFIPVNSLTNEYQSEYQYLDGNVRTTITEQNIQDAANRKLQNYFFPNDPAVSVPALSGTHNVWTQFAPFALSYALGLGYSQNYTTTIPFEGSLISTITGLISSSTAFFDIENTTGENCVPTGTCSNNLYTDQATCLAHSDIWTPGPDSISPFPAVITLKNNLVAAVNTLLSTVTAELAAIPTNDPNPTNQSQNNAAIAYITGTLLPAINTWLSYPDFNPIPGSVSTCSAFYSYNPALLAPTKLHSTELAALQTALNNRLTFITTRVGQLNTVLGTINQNITDGSLISNSGLYGERYKFLSLRLNILTGSLTKLNGLINTSNAQTAIAASIAQNRDTYYGILPTSLFQGPGNGTAIVSLVDVSFLSPGNLVYIAADNQDELVRAVKSISGNSVTLNDQIPPQYSPATNGRLYKDLT